MIKSFLGKHLARRAVKNIRSWSSRPHETQKTVFKQLIDKGKNTAFGKEHGFDSIKTPEDYKKAVPIRNYEDYKPYLDRLLEGESDITWPGKPLYFAKTSGTTSGGAKYIPITHDSIPNHIETARNALFTYIYETGNNDFLKRKMMFLSGSAQLEEIKDIPTGRLSGIVNHHVPFYLQLNQLPSFKTNCISNWETKLEKIIEECEGVDLGFISGIPPWVQMFLERISHRRGKSVADIFPNLSVFVHGGVNFGPYQDKLFSTIGKEIHTLETYPASEGFIAFQDKFPNEGLLLVLNEGIYYEFVPLKEFFNPDPPRYTLQEVEKGVNYVVIVNNNAGLWAYDLGDTVRFVSLEPYRVVVTGRVKQFISAFGEHVIIEEVEQSMTEIVHKLNVLVKEFTIAPMITPGEGKPHHQWYIEFEEIPENLEEFRMELDRALREKNIYYKELVESGILDPLHIMILKKNGFNEYLKSIGKIGGQYKVPRLRNDRSVADSISKFLDTDHPVNQEFLKHYAGNI